MAVANYTVKAGDTLNKIAAAHGYKDYKEAGITGYGSNPDLIKPGQVLTFTGSKAPAGPTAVKEDIAGLGTLTRIPKTPLAGTPQTGVPGEIENAAGLYARTGVTPPPALAPGTGTATTPMGTGTASTPGAPAGSGMAGVPKYGGVTDITNPRSSITEAYNTLSTQITDIENRLKSSATKSAEEQQLEKDLVAKKAALAAFDTETLTRLESFSGQGRGATIANVGLNETKERRTRSLERMGLADDAQALVDQLQLKQSDRENLSEAAKAELTIAGKKLDIALGLSKDLAKLDADARDDARQFLLDTISFTEGKTYDQLDPATQQEIMAATANSPITLGMVKTALKSGADKANKNEMSELLSPAEAKSYNVPYGTTKGQIAGKYAPKDSGGAGSEIDYTDQEKRKLREAGINAADITAADRYLYGDGAKRGVMTIPQLDMIAQGLYGAYKNIKGTDPEDRGADDPDWQSPDDILSYLDSGAALDINDQKVILSDIQRDTIAAQIKAIAEEDKGFFKKVSEGFKSWF